MGLPFVASGLDGKPGKAGSYGRVARSRAIPHDTRRIEFRKMAGAERVCAKFIGEKTGRISASGALFPEFFPAATELGTTKGDNCVGVVDCPTHSRLLQSLPDDSLATCFDHSRTDKETLAPKLGVTHPFSVGVEVVDGLTDFLLDLFLARP